MSILKILDRRPRKQGVALHDETEATAFLAENMKPVLEDDIPFWHRLGVL